MIGHTQGPWSFDYQNDTGQNDDCFVEWYGMDGVFKADRIEDARLIAAAPDLLEALEWAMDRIGYCQRTGANNKYCDQVDKANAAISKARGE